MTAPAAKIDMTKHTPGPWVKGNVLSQEDHYLVELHGPDKQLVASVYGDTHGEAMANAQLFVNISNALANAVQLRQKATPQPGVKLRILVDNPSGAALKHGALVTAIADPDEADITDGPVFWVEDKDGCTWGLDPQGNMQEWELA